MTRGTHVVEFIVRADTMKVRDIRGATIAGDDVWLMRGDSVRRIGGSAAPVLTPAIARIYHGTIVRNRETQALLDRVKPPV